MNWELITEFYKTEVISNPDRVDGNKSLTGGVKERIFILTENFHFQRKIKQMIQHIAWNGASIGSKRNQRLEFW